MNPSMCNEEIMVNPILLYIYIYHWGGGHLNTVNYLPVFNFYLHLYSAQYLQYLSLSLYLSIFPHTLSLSLSLTHSLSLSLHTHTHHYPYKYTTEGEVEGQAIMASPGHHDGTDGKLIPDVMAAASTPASSSSAFEDIRSFSTDSEIF
jgi:hypothetical protein